MRVGIIGAGNIGATLARRLVEAGYHVAIANARGPQTLGDVAIATGARAVSIEEVASGVDALVLSIPQRATPSLRPELFARAPVVIDTNNYYPFRDDRIAALDNGLADSVWVTQHVRRPVVKAFNSIQSHSLAQYGRPPWRHRPHRVAAFWRRCSRDGHFRRACGSGRLSRCCHRQSCVFMAPAARLASILHRP
ncbi:MAG TPA: NAD(P)-binding domain-containing protein [Terricaulis sp.]|nr:NAD(P)-binding domain-containing protein [Terricaulis sp.]